MSALGQIATQVELWLTRTLGQLLVRPLPSYEQRVPNSIENLRHNLRKGDVILVEGDQRISQVIKYLTQSSWSHTAIFVGDELRRYNPALARELEAEHGEDGRHLVLEADNDGVICSPISKYARFNLRVCRPRSLRKEDLDRVVATLFRQLGRRYNFRHVFELGRYFFPVSIVPRRFRKTILHYAGEHKHEVICSTLLARAFASVGYPIVPRVTVDEIDTPATLWQRLRGRKAPGFRALYREENPALITPRDFDLSPYFDIVKVNYLSEPNFDYRRIAWADRLDAHAPLPAAIVPAAVPAVAAEVAVKAAQP